jgi:hydrophobe/amphiphile efflux-1 (HAE1) family protein
MRLAEPFIQRPVATVLLCVGILLLGALSFSRLPIASMPAAERPTIAVQAQYSGANADTIGSALAQPLERQLGIIPGIIEMTSFSATGGTQIVLQFDLTKDVDVAAGEVQAAINAAGPDLPRDMPYPPTYHKVNPSGNAPVAIALTSDVLTPGEVYDYADGVVVQKLSELPGVARVIVTGAERSAVRVSAAPRLLANMGLSLEQLRVALRAATQNLPKGSLDVGDRSYGIEANDQIRKAAEFADLVVAYRGGAAVRLSDVAQVTDSVINTRLAGWYGDQRAVLVFVFKQPEANVVEMVDAVKAMVPKLDHWLPPSLKVNVLFDRTILIRASIAEVEATIVIAVVLIVLIVALFLRRLWATLIPAFTIPVVLGATVVVMNLAGYSLDNLSLMAITISIGFIVDDAVIIVENITRLTDEGDDAVEASLKGTRQMGFTVISITGALIGALLPVLFMPDIVGRYFREFGVTLAAAIVASAVVSLTLTPMLCSRLLGRSARPPPHPRDGAEAQSTSTLPEEVKRARGSLGLRAYGRSLDWALAHPVVVVSLLLLTTIGTVGLYVARPQGFMPTQDVGLLTVRTYTIANVSFNAMEQLQRTVTTAILRDRAVEGLASYIGTDNGTALSVGTIIVNLKPLEQRKQSIQEVIVRLRTELGKIAGARFVFLPWQDLVLGTQSGGRYMYTLKGQDPDELLRWSEALRRRMLAMPELTDIISSSEVSGLEAGMTIDRERAAAYGVTPLAIDNTLYDAFGQRWVKIIYLPFNYSQVILEVDAASQADPSVLNDIYVAGAKAQVPLAALMRPRRAHASMWIRHSEQFPAITLSFDTRPGIAIGDAMAAIRSAKADLRLPDQIKAEFRGEAAEATKSSSKQLLLALGAVFAVYVMLGMLYESYAHPFTILTTLPSALFGALLALTVTGTELTLVAWIASILVVGIVMKNAIMMVDFALAAERQQGLSAATAIRLAATLRARPIVMTSLVAILSAVPLALGTGHGHELRQPLGIATVGGLLAAQMLTLYTTPVVYLLVARLSMRRGRRIAATALDGSVGA